MTICSVSGELQPEQLGFTLTHEHIVARRGQVREQFPHLFDTPDMIDTVAGLLSRVMACGVTTICDPTVMGIGRDVPLLIDLAQRTGLQIIFATGSVYDDQFESPPRFLRSIDAPRLAQLYIHDLTVGAQGTSAKAGFLKGAVDSAGLTPEIEKNLHAIALAHLATGAPIMVHTVPTAGNALQVLDLFERADVNLSRVLIAHCGDTADLAYIRVIADRGAYVGLDRYAIANGANKYAHVTEFPAVTTTERDRVALALCELGYTEQLLLSHDTVFCPDFPQEHAESPATYIPQTLMPWLRVQGVSDADLHCLTEGNAASWLTPSTTCHDRA